MKRYFFLTLFIGTFLSYGQTVRTVGTGKTYSTITDALTVANNGDIIDIYGTITSDGVSTYGINVTKNVIFRGQGPSSTIIEGASSLGGSDRRVFTVYFGSTVTIKNLTIRYGNPGTNGGGIENQGTLTIDNCILENNQSSGSTVPFGQGGGIRNGGNLTIKNSFIRNNTSTNYRGGGIFHSGSNLSIDNCNIQGNSSYTQGGGIQIENATSTISNSLIYSNSLTLSSGSDINGAGIFYGISSGNFTNYLTNCTVSGNSGSSVTYGGGIGITSSYSATSNVIILNSTIADNTASNAKGIQQYSYNTSTNNLTLTNCIISNGSADNYYPYSVGTLTLTRNNTICNDPNPPVSANQDMSLTGTDNSNQDPLINSLANNGGFTQTHALQSSSPAIDAGTPSGAPTTDQRGLPRNGSTTDIGAFEYGHTVWDGSASTNWATNTNWTSGNVPTSSDNIYILSNNPYQPIIGASTSAACNNISIYPKAALTINSSGSLTVSGKLKIESDNTGSGMLIDNNASSSLSGTIESYMNGGTNGYIHYVSSPVDGKKGSNIIRSTKGNYNAYKFDDAANPKWIRIFDADNLENGIGYYAAYNDTTTNWFSGTFNTGTFTPSIIQTNHSWNLLGNPYPSPVSSTTFISNNNTYTTGALYFWDDDHTGGSSSNYSTSDYSVRNSTGATLSSQGNYPDNSIAIGQGFFVESTGAGNTVAFSNAMREENNPHFFITESDLVQKFWFDLSDENNAFNQILIAFSGLCSDGFDNGYDANKLQGNPNISFYSLSPDKDYELVIQTISNTESTKSIPIGFFAGNGGIYSLKLSNLENWDENTLIILEDKINTSFTDLKKNVAYQFSSDKGEFNDRFILHFRINSIGIQAFEICNTVNIFSSSSSVYVFFENQPKNDITLTVRDILGRKVSSNILDKQQNKIDLILTGGYYIVSLNHDNKIISSKVLIH